MPVSTSEELPQILRISCSRENSVSGFCINTKVNSVSFEVNKIELTGVDKVRLSLSKVKSPYCNLDDNWILAGRLVNARIDAETVAWNAGIKIADCAEEGKLFKNFNRQITDIQDGDWTSVAQAAFGNRGAAEFTVKAASKSGGQIEIHMDSPEGALVGTVNVEATGSEDTFKEFSCKLDRITDTHNVFV